MFATPLQLRYIGDERWEVIADFEVSPSDTTRIVVGKGFVTDLASVPRIPGVYAWLKSRAVRSAVVHDWLWQIGYPRPKADRLFRRMIRAETGSRLMAATMYVGVRIGSLLKEKQSSTTISSFEGVYVWDQINRKWIREWP